MRLIFLFLLTSLFVSGQSRNNIWCFGDSAGIDFTNINNPVPIASCVNGRGSCVSICDSSGQLLWYAYTHTSGNSSTVVRSRNDSIMQNGTGIVGEGWYRELVIVPDPANNARYYLISSSVTAGGLAYSIIDINQNGGLGSVIQKNIQLLPINVCDGLQALKHGNGRDWWVMVRSAAGVTNSYYKFLITPTGIQGPFIQNIGTSFYHNLTKINFSPSGKKAVMITYNDVLELYDFDRCSGDFSNPVYLNLPTGFPPFYHMWGCEFSSNENFLYVSTNLTELYQVDLRDTNPWNSRDTLWVQDSLESAGGLLELGPDGKIYFTCSWYDGVHYNYPYPDSAYYPENMNIGVINYPDSVGSACDFHPYSFYLGGKRTYKALPNNPDYDLPAWGGSVCDTLGIWNQVPNIGITTQNSRIHIFYHPDWQTAFINVEGLNGRNYTLHIVDISGKEVFSENGSVNSKYYSKDFPCEKLSNGIYMVLFETEKERLVQKMVIE